ncbi:MAG TPA: hypothetical protein VGO62_07180, partial [Myxococcota bacterium]
RAVDAVQLDVEKRAAPWLAVADTLLGPTDEAVTWAGFVRLRDHTWKNGLRLAQGQASEASVEREATLACRALALLPV